MSDINHLSDKTVRNNDIANIDRITQNIVKLFKNMGIGGTVVFGICFAIVIHVDPVRWKQFADLGEDRSSAPSLGLRLGRPFWAGFFHCSNRS